MFFKVLMNLRNPNYDNGEQPSFRTHLGLIQVPLKVKDIPELVSGVLLTKVSVRTTLPCQLIRSQVSQ